MDSDLPVAPPDVMEWVRRAAVAVTTYLGRYPVKYVLISIKYGGPGAIYDGMTQAGCRITIYLGRDAKAADLMQDWMMTHEMFHLAFPTLDERYSWMMEGLSDYLEPLARARAGQLTDRNVWKGLVEGLPQGLPEQGDRGLDNTPTHDRIYWGGTLYWLLADLQIREKTSNRRSVDDAIRAIVHAGGDGSADWRLDQVLDVGDKATETTVLKDLHDELGSRPAWVDLDALWKRLGVVDHNGAVSFDESAPLANIRASMTARQK